MCNSNKATNINRSKLFFSSDKLAEGITSAERKSKINESRLRCVSVLPET